jgi:transcriptional regulator GlxA family with amidase domain
MVTRVEPDLLDALLRLVGLIDAPADIPVLAPLIQREIIYRVLSGPQGPRLRQTAASGAPTQPIAQAISWIRDHAAEPLVVEDVARRVGMGVSAFHLHFKTVTGISPIRFQKRLRLLEARRLMVSAGLTASEASSRVGYASPSQFSRDYRKAFGAPPRRDVASLRSEASV